MNGKDAKGITVNRNELQDLPIPRNMAEVYGWGYCVGGGEFDDEMIGPNQMVRTGIADVVFGGESPENDFVPKLKVRFRATFTFEKIMTEESYKEWHARMQMSSAERHKNQVAFREEIQRWARHILRANPECDADWDTPTDEGGEEEKGYKH